ncbi:hypothetical protein ACFYW9_19300 [Streptomyces sp. NPDC002698]|uniref:hypothetical protein n=1 Tax=Streptomyces sp. NPDC002698 TaxID=3364660 RepID=UPI00368F0B21
MRVDPLPLLIEFLQSSTDIPEDAVTGTMVGRNVGETSVLLIQSGGFRMKRGRMDRMDVLYDVYGRGPAEAGALAYVVRELLLEHLPGLRLKGALVLDVAEISAPHWHPDQESLEPAYTGEVSLFLTSDD